MKEGQHNESMDEELIRGRHMADLNSINCSDCNLNKYA